MRRHLPIFLLVALSACSRSGAGGPSSPVDGRGRPHAPIRPEAPLLLPTRPVTACPGGAATCPLDLPCGAGCGDNATCKGTGSSAACVCDPGFARAGGACVDVDECADSPCSGEHAVCVNTPGSFRCDCAAGYEGKAPFCTDTDECLDPRSCDANAYCRNEDGSFTCACRSGFLGDGHSCRPDHMDGFVRLRVGGDHACALRADGSIWCWGGRYGLGAGPRADGSQPVLLPGKERWVDFDAAGAGGATDFTAALSADGLLFSFGLDRQALTLDGAPFQTVRTSGIATCTGGSDGEITCEGPGLETPLHRDVVDFGLGPEDACFVWPGGSVDCTHPGTAPPGTFHAVASGHREACGIRDDGALFCWGLGRGSDPARQLGANDDWLRVELGDDAGSPVNHHLGCGLRRGGRLSCWGQNLGGGVGDGGAWPTLDPVPVIPEDGWVDFGVGRGHACGLREDGAVYCWGSNDQGQLGRGPAFAPVAGDVQVPGNYTSVDSGQGYACAIRTDGTLSCWGHAGAPWVRARSFYDGESYPGPRAMGARRWSKISVALWHACGLTDGGSLFCWGDRLASGLSGPSAQGVDLDPVALAPEQWFTDVWAGDFYSCARRPDGTQVCWGALPDGRLVPEPVDAGPGWGFTPHVPAVATGCSLRAPDQVWCWGEADYGQRGDGLGFDPVPRAILWPVPEP